MSGRNHLFRMLALAAVLAVGLIGCGKTEPPAPAAAPAAAPAPAAPEAAPAAAAPTAPAAGDFYVYLDDGAEQNHWIPSGWMGDVSAIEYDQACTDNPKTGSTCIKISYNVAQKQQGWCGIFWQDPEGNWKGEIPNAGYNVAGSTAVKFWARGAKGGERLKFGFGGMTGQYGDSAKKEMQFTLTNQWAEYEIPTTGLDLSTIHFGFMFAIDSRGNDPQKVTFFLDDIRYVK